MGKKYANTSPQCRKCKYRARVGSGLIYCGYMEAADEVPGYVGEDGVYHRDTDPCPEFEPKAKQTPEEWIAELMETREALHE